MNQFGTGSSSSQTSESLFPGFPTLDVGRLITSVRKRLWIAMLVAAVFVGLAITYVMLATKVYQSSAVIYVDPKNEGAVFNGITGAAQASWSTLDALKSLASGISNGAVILRVVDKLELRKDPTFMKPKDDGTGYTDAEVVNFMSRKVYAELRRGTRLIDISVKDESPERAQKMAAAFIDEFQNLIREQNSSSALKSRSILEKEVREQEQRVKEAEDAAQAFRIANSGISFSDEKDVSSMKELDRLLNSAANEVLLRKAEYDQYKNIPNDQIEKVLAIGANGSQDHIQKILLERNSKRAEFSKIKNQFKPAHPAYIECQNELAGLEEQVRVVAETVGQSIEDAYHRSVEQEAGLRESIQEQKLTLIKEDGIKQEYRALRRSVDAANATYQSLLHRLNDSDVTDEVDETVVRIFSPPLVPSKPVAPKKKLTVMIAGVFGSMCGLALVIGIGLLDRTLSGRRQVESTLNLTVLAEVPQAFEKDWDLKDSVLVTREPSSLVSESFRSLRTSLSSFSPRSVMITSSTPGEGKSFCAANLAVLQANMGYRTLLVDADFCKPRMAEVFVDPMRGEAKEGAITAQNLCQETIFQNLYLLSCGRFTSNTGEPMNGELFAQMLQEAYSSFDCVIIDTSPINVVSDALTYSRHADAVVLVVRSGKTRADSAKHALRELQRMRATVVGCVLNGSKEVNEDREAYVEGTSRNQSSFQPNLAAAASQSQI